MNIIKTAILIVGAASLFCIGEVKKLFGLHTQQKEEKQPNQYPL